MMKIHSSTNRMKPSNPAALYRTMRAVGSKFTPEGYRHSEPTSVILKCNISET